MTNPSISLAEIASQRPALTRELERLGLDYCCGGKRSLGVACTERGLDVEAITAELNRSPAAEVPADDWIALTPAELVDHLEGTHHRYLKQELPRLSELAAKVSRVHGEKHPELVQAAAVLSEIRADLEPHLLQKEEHDHTAVCSLLERLRQLTGGYEAPADTCASTRALMAGLAELEADTHRHVHKENNHLFPAVLAQEQPLVA